MLLQFIGQPFKGIFVRDSTFSGRDDYKHVIVTDVLCQSRQFVPMGHEGILCTHIGMVVIDVFTYQLHGFIAPMELDAAVQVTRHATEALQPAVEARFELGTRRHCNLYAT